MYKVFIDDAFSLPSDANYFYGNKKKLSEWNHFKPENNDIFLFKNHIQRLKFCIQFLLDHL